MTRPFVSQLLYHQVRNKPGAEIAATATVTESPTLLVDLTAAEEDLWQAIGKRTREYIRAAERLPHELAWTASDVDGRFYEFLERFRAEKAFAPIPRPIYEQYLENGLISSCSEDGDILVMHFYVVDREIGRARLMWSARALSASDRTIARLNKLLHWRDLLHLKNELDVGTYDWGGYSVDEEMYKGVDEFKRRFGGTLVTEYTVLWESRLYSRLRRLLRRTGASG